MPADHTEHGVRDMLSGEDVRRLKGRKGSAVDTAFPTMTLQHHEGAIAMAERGQAGGVHGPAGRTAASAVSAVSAASAASSRTAEIGTMKRLPRWVPPGGR